VKSAIACALIIGGCFGFILGQIAQIPRLQREFEILERKAEWATQDADHCRDFGLSQLRRANSLELELTKKNHTIKQLLHSLELEWQRRAKAPKDTE
jgi:hypothetical protein